MEQFRQQLFYLINNTNLSIDAIYYIFKDVYRDLESAYATFINQQIQPKQEEEQE